MSKIVSCLFVRPNSIYKSLGLDCWDIERDARNFSGGNAVVAHPPCRAWGKLKHFARPRPGEKECGLYAVDVVRSCGGVLEHPYGSTLFKQMFLPKPGKYDPYGGYTIEVNQYDFGHRAEKKTWLYIVGCPADKLPAIPKKEGTPQFVVSSSKYRKGDKGFRSRITNEEREATPILFAEFLIKIATVANDTLNPPKRTKMPSTLGGKNGNGTPQNLINHVPEHRAFCTLFARYCGLHKNIRPAKTTIINDLDPDIYKIYRDRYLGNVDVGVFCLDAITILQNKGIGSLSLDLTTTFIYLDPPYLHSTRKNPETNKYKFELTDAQHQALIDAALQFKHAKIMISHYECDLYNQLLAAGWYKHSYMSMTRGGLVQETIYFNYPPPTLLHDYRYIGADFREREALKRVKVNLIKKLDRLEPVLRNSILTDLASHYSAVHDQQIKT